MLMNKRKMFCLLKYVPPTNNLTCPKTSVNIINMNDNQPTPLEKYLTWTLKGTDPWDTLSSRSSNNCLYQ